MTGHATGHRVLPLFEERDSAQIDELAFDTSPPEPTSRENVFRRVKGSAIGAVSAWILPLMQRAGRAYVGGERVEDAIAIARRFAEDGIPSTLGFWDTADYSAEQVASIYVHAIEHVAASGLDTYLSLKPPAIRFDTRLALNVAAHAHASNIRLHCDSHGPESATPSHAMEEIMLEDMRAENLSTTLPARWSRSLSDAQWAIDRGLRVRVVKGQWPDPVDPQRDPRIGYLEVIDKLAGRARHVGVASHDVALAAAAIARLRASGTACELELLYGMPMTASLRWARDNRVDVRIYIPFGKGFIPSAVGVLRRNPRLAWLVFKDLLARKAPGGVPKES